MERRVFAVGALLAGLAVAFGAFGAHALRASVSSQLLATFETGVRYQMYHGLGLLALARAVDRWPRRRVAPAAWLIAAGSLYLLVVAGQRWLGAVTPLGGLALIAGWLVAAWKILAGDEISSGGS